jgi:hypothetical protein
MIFFLNGKKKKWPDDDEITFSLKASLWNIWNSKAFSVIRTIIGK